MVVISEASDDDSNGGDRNKNPKELQKNPQEDDENQNENPQEDDENQNENQQETEHLPIRQDIPQDLIETIVAIVRRCHYPKLSLVSKSFYRLIKSRDLYETRSRRGLTEPVLYALIGFPPYGPSWYILHRSNIDLRLSRVASLGPMLHGSAVVTVGHKMYVMGGHVNVLQPVNTVIVIDCRFHTCDYLPNMWRARTGAAAGVFDGKIYVVGGCDRRSKDWVEVFNIRKRRWNSVPGPLPDVGNGLFATQVVMQDKIYILEFEYCLAYDPRRRNWESWGIGSPQTSGRHIPSCVIGNMLYIFDPTETLGSQIIVYNPVAMVWKPVNGVHGLPNLFYVESRMVNFGGNLVILGCDHSPFWSHPNLENDIWYIEIVLVEDENGEILGNVETMSRVLTTSYYMAPFIECLRTVRV